MASELVGIHRAVVKRLFSRTSQESKVSKNNKEDETKRLEKELEFLRKRRNYLRSKIDAVARGSAHLTLAEDLQRKNSRRRKRREFEHNMVYSSQTEKGNDIEDAILCTLPKRMQNLRKRRKIAGSHRIAGISVIPCPDDNVLGVRLDICVRGRYVARHFLFFDLVVVTQTHGGGSDSEEEEEDSPKETGMLHLRLVQHTVPSEVPLAEIVDRHLGGMLLLPDGTLNLDAMPIVQRCIGEIYDVCFVRAVRKEMRDYLTALAAATTTDRSVAVTQLAVSDNLYCFGFDLRFSPSENDIISLRVKMTFRTATSTEPPEVSVHQTDGSTQVRHDLCALVSDLLIRCPLWQALDKVASLRNESSSSRAVPQLDSHYIS